MRWRRSGPEPPRRAPRPPWAGVPTAGLIIIIVLAPTTAAEAQGPPATSTEQRRQTDTASREGGTVSLQYDRLPEMIRYNRVESLGLGLAARWHPSHLPSWSLAAGLGLGLADGEPKGKLGLRYDTPRTRIDLNGYSELHLAGRSLTDRRRAYGNALRAFVLGRDDADYYRAHGVAVGTDRRWGRLRGRAALAFERHESVRRHTGVAIPDLWEDSVFRLNPAAEEGTAWRLDLHTALTLGRWPPSGDRAELALSTELGSGPDGHAYVQPRLELASRVGLNDFSLAMGARAGWTGGEAPLQREWRLGGLESVRGYDHGKRRGDAYWIGRLELAHRRGTIAPVVFADLGWAGDVDDWPADRADPIWSLGAGASVLAGVVRTDLVFPASGGPRLELYLGGEL